VCIGGENGESCLAWWNPTTATMGAKLLLGAIERHEDSAELRFVQTMDGENFPGLEKGDGQGRSMLNIV